MRSRMWRSHARRLGDEGGIHVADRKLSRPQQRHDPPQQDAAVDAFKQDAAVDAFKFRAAVGKVLADVAQSRRAQQSIAQGVQQHVAIGMGDQTARMRDADTAQGDEIALPEGVDIETVTDAHESIQSSGLAGDRNGAASQKKFRQRQILRASDLEIVAPAFDQPGRKTGRFHRRRVVGNQSPPRRR